MTEWRQVPGFSRYQVSDAGEVRGRFGRLVKVRRVKGYLVIDVWSDDDRRIKKGVHQLVALAFVGPMPSAAHQVAHGDGVRTNNAASNLKWATQVENEQDKVALGVAMHGERHHAAKLTSADVAAIRQRHPGSSTAALAAEFGVAKAHIRQIVNGTRWRKP